MGGCQNYDRFFGTLNIRCRIIIRTQKGTRILTTTHVVSSIAGCSSLVPRLRGPLLPLYASPHYYLRPWVCPEHECMIHRLPALQKVHQRERQAQTGCIGRERFERKAALAAAQRRSRRCYDDATPGCAMPCSCHWDRVQMAE